MSEEGQYTSTQKRQAKRSSGKGSTSSVSPKESSPTKDTEDFNEAGLSFRFIRVFSWTILALFAFGFILDMSGLRKDWDLPAGIWGLVTIVASGSFVLQGLSERKK